MQSFITLLKKHQFGGQRWTGEEIKAKQEVFQQEAETENNH